MSGTDSSRTHTKKELNFSELINLKQFDMHTHVRTLIYRMWT